MLEIKFYRKNSIKSCRCIAQFEATAIMLSWLISKTRELRKCSTLYSTIDEQNVK